MAQSLNSSIIAVDSNGMPTKAFENYWYGVTQLNPSIEQLSLIVKISDNGMASNAFEALWNTAASILGKEELDANQRLFTEGGFPTQELQGFWEDLIT